MSLNFVRSKVDTGICAVKPGLLVSKKSSDNMEKISSLFFDDFIDDSDWRNIRFFGKAFLLTSLSNKTSSTSFRSALLLILLEHCLLIVEKNDNLLFL